MGRYDRWGRLAKAPPAIATLLKRQAAGVVHQRAHLLEIVRRQPEAEVEMKEAAN
jgi:hypothetical protein